MDLALEKQCNKAAKNSSVVIGFIKRKEVVWRRNIIKQEKHQFSEVLSKICYKEGLNMMKKVDICTSF